MIFEKLIKSDKYTTHIYEAYSLVQQLHFDVACVSLIGTFSIIISLISTGELFGGVYPHPDVPDIGHQPVQRGVYYSAIVDFYAFDIKIKQKDGSEFFLDFDVASKIFSTCKFFYAVPVVTGNLEECFAYKIDEAHSTIPGLLGTYFFQLENSTWNYFLFYFVIKY